MTPIEKRRRADLKGIAIQLGEVLAAMPDSDMELEQIEAIFAKVQRAAGVLIIAEITEEELAELGRS
jgi:hypothetical protein